MKQQSKLANMLDQLPGFASFNSSSVDSDKHSNSTNNACLQGIKECFVVIAMPESSQSLELDELNM